MQIIKKGNPRTARMVIDELGTQKILKEGEVTKSTVSTWRRLGFPIYFEKYLRSEYPKLHAWNKTEREA